MESAVTFTCTRVDVNWPTAKSRCESMGQRLAVLDTKEKREALREQK